MHPELSQDQRPPPGGDDLDVRVIDSYPSVAPPTCTSAPLLLQTALKSPDVEPGAPAGRASSQQPSAGGDGGMRDGGMDGRTDGLEAAACCVSH